MYVTDFLCTINSTITKCYKNAVYIHTLPVYNTTTKWLNLIALLSICNIKTVYYDGLESYNNISKVTKKQTENQQRNQQRTINKEIKI